MTCAYYNEIDPYAAQWLRNLIAAGHIAPGEVDERSIVDVQPDDLAGFTQCHFFAGIGGWSYALRLAGWADDRPVWTGSCPCQPFSVAGDGAGFTDERDLWPAWLKFIRERRPAIIFGEQVAAATLWLDRVFADMEGEAYAVAASVLPACAVDAPHRRDRLWFVANADTGQREQPNETIRARRDATRSGSQSMANANGPERRTDAQGRRNDSDWQDAGRQEAPGGYQFRGPRTLADPNSGHGFWWSGPLQVGRNTIEGQAETSSQRGRTQWRVKPGVSLLAHGIPARVAKLRAFGNAIVPQVAAEFIGAYMDTLLPTIGAAVKKG